MQRKRSVKAEVSRFTLKWKLLHNSANYEILRVCKNCKIVNLQNVQYTKNCKLRYVCHCVKVLFNSFSLAQKLIDFGYRHLGFIAFCVELARPEGKLSPHARCRCGIEESVKMDVKKLKHEGVFRIHTNHDKACC
jgi:hypothetical protein